MTEKETKPTTKDADNPYCHADMVCTPGCGCAGDDGICHCKMISAQKCVCDGFCGLPKH